MDTKTKMRKKTLRNMRLAKRNMKDALYGLFISGFPRDIAIEIASTYKNLEQLVYMATYYSFKGRDVRLGKSTNYNTWRVR